MNKAQKQVTQAQLNREKQTIKELKQVYQKALRDCEQKIRELSERTDMENLQSIIYQKQYQEALKAQLEGILSNLQSNSYATVSDYLTKCYRDGYTGVMYDLQQTGIPIIMPIDQAAVVRAIQTDSKLSKSLYDKMGEDVTYLKKAVRAEVSRGIANGSTWNEVAGKLSRHMANTPFQRAYNNSIRIARTEGHRVQVQSALDAQHVAKSKGADIVKQWDATLDGATREHHQMLDGQIREVDEPFEVANLKVEAPGMFGLASEDCNCRCCLLQRARWALDDEELPALKDRAAYFDLDKTKEFEEYQRKYLGITQEDIDNYVESVKIGARANSGKKVFYDEKNDYSIKIETLSDSVNESLSNAAENVAKLGNKDGNEHMHLIDLDGIEPPYYETDGMPDSVGYRVWKYIKQHPDSSFAFVHNHNTDNSFSLTDLETPITCKNIPIQIAVRNDGVKYIAIRKKMAPEGYYPDIYFRKQLESLNMEARNGDITPAERMRKREKLLTQLILEEFYGGIITLDGRK